MTIKGAKYKLWIDKSGPRAALVRRVIIIRRWEIFNKNAELILLFYLNLKWYIGFNLPWHRFNVALVRRDIIIREWEIFFNNAELTLLIICRVQPIVTDLIC